MVVVKGKSPEITLVRPDSRPEQLQQQVWISGTGFTVASTVTVGGVAMASVALIADGRLQCLLPAGQLAGDAPIVVTEGVYDSHEHPFTLDATTPQSGDQYPTIDQRKQPMDASFKGRSDQQRIAATKQFTGKPPETVQGAIGDAGTPISGGFWSYNQKVIIEHIEWKSVGVEPGARGAGSGIFIGRKNLGETLLVDLANTRFAAAVPDGFELSKGEYVRIVTLGATLEMVANVHHKAYSRGLSR